MVKEFIPKKILIIQTAFIGDVILATPVMEALHLHFPDAEIDFLLRKGNESLFEEHPFLHHIWIWDKKNHKTLHQLALIKAIRKQNIDLVINLQRFLSSGIFTLLSKAKIKIGFKKNPLSFGFKYAIAHNFAKGTHEIDRNLSLLKPLIDDPKGKIKLYPSAINIKRVQSLMESKYLVIAPNSVWETKQLPAEKWIEFINLIPKSYIIYCIGSKNDYANVEQISKISKNERCLNLCGKLSFLESAALMQHASMNYVNDSAPLHIASAMNAPVTTVFCSTIPEFGFGPLSETSFIVETKEPLACRPCGLHGQHTCPEGHFKCAQNIQIEQLQESLKNERARNN
jgi:heptosyltransferase-2